MSDVIIVSWTSGTETYYGLVTNKSYPHVYGFGVHLGAAKEGKKLGADFVDTLGISYDLNSLESYDEVM